MRFAFTEQQLELRQAVRAVLERECTTGDLRAIADKTGDGRTAERWKILSEMGAPGLLVAEDRGGVGQSELELVGVLEEAGWVALPEPLAESAALAATALARVADLAAHGASAIGAVERFLPELAAGHLVATLGGVDVHAAGPASSTTAGPKDKAVTPRVAGVTRAGLFLLARETPNVGWELFALEAGSVDVSPTPSIDATRDLGTVEWTPSPHSLLAAGAHGAAIVSDVADVAAVAEAAQLLGLSDRMISMTADYAKARQQFGRPIGSFQAVKHHLADARVRLEFARPATYRAADSLARRLAERSEHASMAKALATDAAQLAAHVALQVHGAIGYTWECDLHLFMKRAWALGAAWGDAPTQRARVLAAALERIAG